LKNEKRRGVAIAFPKTAKPPFFLFKRPIDLPSNESTISRKMLGKVGDFFDIEMNGLGQIK